MAVQTFTSSDNLTVQQWSEGLEAEALKKVSFSGLIGKRSDSLIQWKDSLSKKPGDTETIGLRMQLSGAPKTSSDTIENNEQTLEIYNMNYTIDETVDAVRFKNVIDRQRVTFDMRDEARAALADQLANAIDYQMFNQLGGNLAETEATLYGHNTPVDPGAAGDLDHYFNADATKETLDESLSTNNSTDIFTIDLLERAVEKAKTITPTIRPARIEGFNRPLYVCFLHPFQMSQIRGTGASTNTKWYEAMLAAMQGGRVNDNPIVTGAVGIWDDVLLVESYRVPTGVNSSTGAAISTVRRAIFCGAQSAVIGWGRLGGTPNRFRWVEKQFDYDREYGVMAGFLGGIKKTNFNSLDFGTIVISSDSQGTDVF